ncbi:MAG TPA: glycosyltransferase [Candidatus Omnitrophota bacterium]|nr:glycosyltransferase [Candidatus Omnitrophota bacterium]HPN55669.1 glycosyltransferase [Candidatus Omnitrophota bacterium]
MNTFKELKIALGNEIKDGPWGGGNQFLISFKKYFEGKGACVVHHLEDGLDVIILINPRPESGTFTHKDIKKYKKSNPRVKVIHRVNETDRAKNTCHIDRLRLEANKVADAVVFISEWVQQYYRQRGMDPRTPAYVAHNGPDESIFHHDGYRPWQDSGPMKIVTHHWSNNPMKGIDVYDYFDKLLEDSWMQSRFQFTYIGRYPAGTEFRHTRTVPPLSGADLARELRSHHVYLTAARWESCGMHQLEGACCGLPVLYINEGGGVVETCREAGIEYTAGSFPVALFKMRDQYARLQPKMKTFPFNASAMCRQYESVLQSVLNSD